MTNMSTTLNQTQASAEEAQQIAIQARVYVNMMSPDTGSTIMHSASMDAPRLRKMDVSPPSFDELIDGIKLNSFLFQFESYFQQKGYDLTHHDHVFHRELNQCVRKNALIWYERDMTDDLTTKLWSVMKSGMIREFREPNFQAKVRNQLLKMKQTGGYHGYLNKFR
ncbi:Hypothetical protein PHPALM_36219 [Phytophthora palmivora]|uniref:Retrotransposon gag domain-containing protein n=1 Tax=Phytophthora palmivora TaxID=4796 RepID=A0A2P4X0I8_9STRA|nr:Hypothetical protein PHPALM_36219 [Phytophthora palmivora]